MALQRLFSPTSEQTNKTGWALVKDIERQLRACRRPEVHQAINLILEQARSQASSPQCWATHFAQAVVETLEAFQAAAASAKSAGWQIDLLNLECASLRHALAECEADPLQDQVSTLTAARDESYARATQAEQSMERLTKKQGILQTEIANLKQTITDLNRIVAQQQEQLNAANK
jgi:chromosome segregation ATPase